MRKFFMSIPIALMAIGSTTACATKKFVRTSVGEVNEKVDAVNKSLEETQERTRRNEGRIAEVDQKAQDAANSAQQANAGVNEAKQATAQVASNVTATNGRIDNIDKQSKRLVYEVVLSED